VSRSPLPGRPKRTRRKANRSRIPRRKAKNKEAERLYKHRKGRHQIHAEAIQEFAVSGEKRLIFVLLLIFLETL
jgi:hypothetical protein